MYYAYLKEDNDLINLVDNTGVFSLIQDLGIREEDTFTDEGSREQLGKLLEVIGVIQNMQSIISRHNAGRRVKLPYPYQDLNGMARRESCCMVD